MTVGRVAMGLWLTLAKTRVQLVLSSELVSELDQRTVSPPRALSNSLMVTLAVVTEYALPSELSRLRPGFAAELVRLITTVLLVTGRFTSVCFTGLPSIAVRATTPGGMEIEAVEPSTGLLPVIFCGGAV